MNLIVGSVVYIALVAYSPYSNNPAMSSFQFSFPNAEICQAFHEDFSKEIAKNRSNRLVTASCIEVKEKAGK